MTQRINLPKTHRLREQFGRREDDVVSHFFWYLYILFTSTIMHFFFLQFSVLVSLCLTCKWYDAMDSVTSKKNNKPLSTLPSFSLPLHFETLILFCSHSCTVDQTSRTLFYLHQLLFSTYITAESKKVSKEWRKCKPPEKKKKKKILHSFFVQKFGRGNDRQVWWWQLSEGTSQTETTRSH